MAVSLGWCLGLGLGLGLRVSVIGLGKVGVGAQAGCESGRAWPDRRHSVHPGVLVHPSHRVIQTSSHCLWLSL